jgi:hypothetical protein
MQNIEDAACMKSRYLVTRGPRCTGTFWLRITRFDTTRSTPIPSPTEVSITKGQKRRADPAAVKKFRPLAENICLLLWGLETFQKTHDQGSGYAGSGVQTPIEQSVRILPSVETRETGNDNGFYKETCHTGCAGLASGAKPS